MKDLIEKSSRIVYESIISNRANRIRTPAFNTSTGLSSMRSEKLPAAESRSTATCGQTKHWMVYHPVLMQTKWPKLYFMTACLRGSLRKALRRQAVNHLAQSYESHHDTDSLGRGPQAQNLYLVEMERRLGHR